MGVLLKKRNGKFLPDWYGELIEDGKRKVVNLHVRWRGKPVESLRDKGGDLFEETRKKAREELEKLQIHWREKGRAEHLTARLIEAKTGRKLEYVKLSELADKWRGVPRTRTPGKGWLSWCDTLFSRLAAECPVTYLHEVTPEMAAMHLQAIRAKCSHKTAGEAAQAAMQISASSGQQLAGMEQIKQAIESINQAGTQAAAGTRQVEQEVSGVREVAFKLKRLVDAKATAL